MKAIQLIILRATSALAAALLFTLPARAQMSDNYYGSIDWQFNFPISNHFTDNASGWGMAMEGGRFLTDNYALGLFVNFHSNHEYVGRQTLPAGNNGSVTTDQQHTTFQLPFGLATRYTWNRNGDFQPYVGSKIGAEYAQLKSNFSTFQATENTWGLYLSTEIGVGYYPRAYGPGIHFAVYYSYGTNKGDLMTVHVKGLQNIGFRVGLAF